MHIETCIPQSLSEKCLYSVDDSKDLQLVKVRRIIDCGKLIPEWNIYIKAPSPRVQGPRVQK